MRTAELLTMSTKELERAELLCRIRERRITQVQAAVMLGVSARQLRRWYQAYKAGGPAALASKKRGRPSNNQLPETVKLEALRLVRERYTDFGPTLAHEKLTEAHGVRVSVETLRKWMREAGLWSTRAERRKRAQQPRLRRQCRGELVQIDGCDHDWLENRGARCVLLVYVDDATSELMELQFVASESTFDYFASTRRYLERHGKPVAFYSDKASIFRVNAKDPAGGDRFTQFGRAMHDLNIDIICANTAAAKGRVERAHLTLQDRLVKELRIRNICSVEEGNRFLPHFMVDYNRRFGRAPMSAHNAHRPMLPHERLDDVFQWQEDRRVTNNLTLHYKRIMYILEPSNLTEAVRGKRVQVFETVDGEVSIRHAGVELRARAFPKDGRVDQGAIVANKLLAPVLEQIRQKQLERDQKKLGDRWRTLREKKRIEASIEAREGATPALPAPPVSPPLVHPLLGRALALGRLLAAEGPDAAMRAIERGELREPAEQSPDQLSKGGDTLESSARLRRRRCRRSSSAAKAGRADTGAPPQPPG
jgi:transposase